jgi:hypothetical protein
LLRRFAVIAAIGCPVAATAAPVFSDLARPNAAHALAELRGAPTAVVVWKSDCTPCIVELMHLHEIAAGAQRWRIVTLALDEAQTAMRALPPQARVAVGNWYTAAAPSQVLAALNPTQPVLPLTIAVSTHGEICARRIGLLGSDVLNGWSAQCSR